jgi:hypothetical protein
MVFGGMLREKCSDPAILDIYIGKRERSSTGLQRKVKRNKGERDKNKL